MTGAAHTPGPWEWDGNYLVPTTPRPDVSAVHTILSPEGSYSYIGADLDASRAENEANRALIAAAPDMASALVVIKRNLDLAPRGNTHIDALRDLVDSALAKGMPE